MRARGGGERREGREKWAAEALGRRLKRWAAGGGGARVELGLRSVGKVLFFFKAFVSNLFKFFKL
jgi:hypothetical protein